MRCLSCNCELTDFEATRKYAGTTDFVDLCNNCFNEIALDVLVVERHDLRKNESFDVPDDELFDELE